MSLRRELGFWEIVLAGVGVIIGAGIYALIGKGAGIAGSNVWASFAVGGFIALMTGLSYAELSSRFPKAGAEYVYARSTFGEVIARVCGLALLLVGFTSAAAVALGFGGYLSGLIPIPAWVGALFVVGVSFLILLRGAKFAADLADGISMVEIVGLLVVLAIGLPTITKGFAIPAISQIPTVLYGTAVVFFAFLGFEELVRMAEETKSAREKMPKALLLAVIISSVLYVLVSAAAVGLVGADALAKSDSPLAVVVRPVLGESGFGLMSLAALLSTFNTVLLIILASSRLIYGMAAHQSLPKLFSRTTEGQPVAALLACIVLTGVFVVMRDITFIAQVTDALLFSVFAVMNVVVILLHRRGNHFSGFTVPFSVNRVPIPAVLGALSSAGMLLFVDRGALIFGFGILGGMALLVFLTQRAHRGK